MEPMFVEFSKPNTDGLRSGERDLLRHLQGDRVQLVHVLGVDYDPRLLGVETECDEVEGVLVRHLPGLLQREVLEQELLVIGELEEHVHSEGVLDPLVEYPRHDVAQMGVARGAPAGVEDEPVPLVVLVEEGDHVPVGVEYAAPQHVVEVPVPREPLHEDVVDRGRPEPLLQQVVVYFPGDLPGGDFEIFRHVLYPDARMSESSLRFLDARARTPRPNFLLRERR